MTLEFPQTVSLEEMVRRSQYILLVERAEPFATEEMIDIHNDTKKYPPFRKVTYRYRVVEELLNRQKRPLEREIRVAAAHTSMDLDVHKKRYLEGTNQSTFRPEYETEADFNSKKLIIFLTLDLEFLAYGAFESVENKDKVLKAIATCSS